MYIDKITAKSGSKIILDGHLREMAFEVEMTEVDGDWEDAQERCSGIAEQLIEDWLKKQIEFGVVTPITSQLSASIQPQGFAQRLAQLVFDATGSKDRANRILRAMKEQYEFVRKNKQWYCKTTSGEYEISLDMESLTGHCSCPDFAAHGIKEQMPCKHLYGFVIQTGKVKWDEIKVKSC